MKAYEAYYGTLTKDQRKALQQHHEELKAIAADADGGAK
jgi:hypothetical protein